MNRPSAIAELTVNNRRLRAKATEQQLAEERLDFGSAKQAQQSFDKPWSPSPDSPFQCLPTEIPEVEAEALTEDTLGNGIHHHGAIIVRKLFSSDQAAGYRKQMDAAFLEQELYYTEPEADRDWFNPPKGLIEHPHSRSGGMLRHTGSMWAANSPRIMFNLLEDYEQLNLKDICQSYFGETAFLSVKKWLLRRIQPLQQAADWHQDGAFMGDGVKSLNMWLALSDCGDQMDAPGLDLKPGRINHLVETGTQGATFDWSVGAKAADEAGSSMPTITPSFEVGDAIFFDHLNLHRTSFDESHFATRYAIECWFLGESNYPEKQIPIVW